MDEIKEILRDKVLEKSVAEEILSFKDEFDYLMIYDKINNKKDVEFLTQHVDPFFISVAMKKVTDWKFDDIRIVWKRDIKSTLSGETGFVIRIMSKYGDIQDLDVNIKERIIYCSKDGRGAIKLTFMKE